MHIIFSTARTNKSGVIEKRTQTYAKETAMSDHKNEQNYIESDEEREAGHVDTRHLNFECESFDSIGCDNGVDVAG
jgi:hypothetical protein